MGEGRSWRNLRCLREIRILSRGERWVIWEGRSLLTFLMGIMGSVRRGGYVVMVEWSGSGASHVKTLSPIELFATVELEALSTNLVPCILTPYKEQYHNSSTSLYILYISFINIHFLTSNDLDHPQPHITPSLHTPQHDETTTQTSTHETA